MILDIRGGLGMQVLELIVGLTKARMKNEIIDEIRINTGGNVVSTVKHNYISELFTLPIPVTISDGVLKQNAWTPENFELLADFKYFEPSIGIRLKKDISLPTENVLFHIRGKDRQVSSVENYRKLIRYFHLCNDSKNPISLEIIGDDLDLIGQCNSDGLCKLVNGSTAAEDWMQCVKALILISSFSSFTIAASLFNPIQEVRYLSGDLATGPHRVEKKYWDCLQILIDKKETWDWA
jgi:hypothetical protein